MAGYGPGGCEGDPAGNGKENVIGRREGVSDITSIGAAETKRPRGAEYHYSIFPKPLSDGREVSGRRRRFFAAGSSDGGPGPEKNSGGSRVPTLSRLKGDFALVRQYRVRRRRGVPAKGAVQGSHGSDERSCFLFFSKSAPRLSFEDFDGTSSHQPATRVFFSFALSVNVPRKNSG